VVVIILFRRLFILALGLQLVIICPTFYKAWAAVTRSDLYNSSNLYQPNFRWIKGGSTGLQKQPLEYDYTLFDGDRPIGYFWKDRLSFYEYQLVPGVVTGNPRNQTSGIALYAQNQYWGDEALDVKDFAVDLSDPSKFVMTAHIGQRYIEESEDALDIQARLEVTWDAELNCYAWTLTKKMTILGGNVLYQPYVEFEDTYFQGHYYFDQRYQYYIWKDRDDSYYRMPFNNDKSSDKNDWVYGENGFWLAALDQTSNPALEWLEGYTDHLKTSVCWLYLDLHSYWLREGSTFNIGDTKTVSYRFVNYPYGKAQAILEQSVLRDLPNDPIKTFPMREWPLTRFDKNIYRTTTLGVYSWEPSPIFDPTFPENYDPNCTWDSTRGYDDNYSLKIDATDGAVHRWGLTAVDYGPIMNIQGESSFSFMVKTQGLRGNARLVYCNISYEYSCIMSDPISGTNHWTEVTLKVPDGFYRGGYSYLYFEVQGPGIAWFDNLFRESEASRPPDLSANSFGVRNNNIWIHFAKASDLSHRIFLNLWDTGEGIWNYQSSAFIEGPDVLQGEYPGPTFDAGQGRVVGDFAILDIPMLSQVSPGQFVQLRVTLHKDAYSGLFEAVNTSLPDKKTAFFGFQSQTENTPYVYYYSLENPAYNQLWDWTMFKDEFVHFETISGPACVVFVCPQKGWATFAVLPEVVSANILFIFGGGYLYLGGESHGALIGSLRFTPAASFEEIQPRMQSVVSNDIVLYKAMGYFDFQVIPSQQAGTPFNITITAKDAYGNTATSFSGIATLRDNTGTINPIVTGSFSHGVWTGPVVITHCQPDVVITATAGWKVGTSNSFAVEPTPLDHFDLGPIASEQAGTAFTITITAKDANGNTVTSFSGTAALSDTTGTVSPTLTGNFSSGAWTGSVLIPKAQVGVVITVSAEGKTGSSNPFEVIPLIASGFVRTSGGQAIAGVVMNGFPGNLATGADGAYTAGVDYAWSGTVTPMKAGYTFNPVSKTYSTITSNQTQDYTGTLQSFTISGTVTSSGSPLNEVTMSGLPGNPVTNASGAYSATVDYEWSGTVTPAKAGYIFNPTSKAYVSVSSSQTQDYTATVQDYSGGSYHTSFSLSNLITDDILTATITIPDQVTLQVCILYNNQRIGFQQYQSGNHDIYLNLADLSILYQDLFPASYTYELRFNLDNQNPNIPIHIGKLELFEAGNNLIELVNVDFF
jgi:hypothetical protein